MKFLWSCDHCKMAGQVEAGGTFAAIDRAREAHAAAVPACQWRGLDLRPLHFGPDHDPVESPKHYRSHPSGIQCIEVVEHMDFVIGNIVKYAWRAGLKDGASRLEDLKKCEWYARRAVEREEAKTRKTPENQGVFS